jgi:hypothetical protein
MEQSTFSAWWFMGVPHIEQATLGAASSATSSRPARSLNRCLVRPEQVVFDHFHPAGAPTSKMAARPQLVGPVGRERTRRPPCRRFLLRAQLVLALRQGWRRPAHYDRENRAAEAGNQSGSSWAYERTCTECGPTKHLSALLKEAVCAEAVAETK